MPDFDSASQSFTWAQKRPAYAEIRKRRANKKAWAEDNKKRQRENQPLRTLVGDGPSFTSPAQPLIIPIAPV